MKAYLDTRGQQTLAAQLSNRTIIHINLLDQIYSQQKKEDLHAKMEEFKVVEKETLRREKIENENSKDISKIKENLAKDKLSLMDIKFEQINNGSHNGAISELRICLQRPIVLTASREDSTIRIWNYLSSTCELF